MCRILLVVGMPVVVLFAVIQAVPYGHNHTNPPVQTEPVWVNQRAHDLAVRACYDCHSNQTVWPWYSYVAPVSWLVQRDVDTGRGKLNFSELNRSAREESERREAGEREEREPMPPWYYTLMHPQARISAADRELIDQSLLASVHLVP